MCGLGLVCNFSCTDPKVLNPKPQTRSVFFVLQCTRNTCHLPGGYLRSEVLESWILGSIRETPLKGTLLIPTYDSLIRELIERIYIPKGSP